ncbi:MAG: hypothetical protein QXD14_06910 [Sulfolobales archaeon]
MYRSGKPLGRLSFGRFRRVLWVAGVVSPTLAFVVTMLYVLTPLASYDGWVLSGWVGLLGSDLRAFGEPMYAPPLESVRRVSSVLVVLGSLSLLLSVAAVRLKLSGRMSASLEVAAASNLAAALALTLLYSLLRLVIWDIVPLLEATRSLRTTAGRLYLDPPVVVRPPTTAFFSSSGVVLVLWGVVSVLLAVLLAYRRLSEGELESVKPREPTGGTDGA